MGANINGAAQHHRDALRDVLRWRRVVRHFLPHPVAPEVLERLRAAMDLAPSVGNARPWRGFAGHDACAARGGHRELRSVQ
jgi:hypothetical protein